METDEASHLPPKKPVVSYNIKFHDINQTQRINQQSGNSFQQLDNHHQSTINDHPCSSNEAEFDSSPLPDPDLDIDDTPYVWEDSFGEVVFTRTVQNFENEDQKELSVILSTHESSDIMLYDSEGNNHQITERIVDLEGAGRRPIAHTCGRTLELPKYFKSYPIFKCKFNAVLNSDVWVMVFK
ncbi:unnamed protein product [Mytilus coruscus]|uniref:Uncharacterized protein n=1 Tax=Mytilus coruscus TaxID=42192 RepID=A0A6J8BLU2_MYTCO|nr:unnamed protein product [Mytilus coruscus]